MFEIKYTKKAVVALSHPFGVTHRLQKFQVISTLGCTKKITFAATVIN